MKGLFNIYDEAINVYTFVYCIFVSVLSAYAIMFGLHSEYFDILRTSTLYNMLFSTPKHLIEFVYHSKKLKTKLTGSESEIQTIIRRSTSAKNKALEYLVHHLAAITIFYHTPVLDHNLNFCMIKYTEFHLFEVSTIFITLTASPFLMRWLVGKNQTLELIYKLMFVASFVGIRVLWLLPKFTYDLYFHEFNGDIMWQFHLLILSVLFWGLHVVWTYKLVNKFSRDIWKYRIIQSIFSRFNGPKKDS